MDGLRRLAAGRDAGELVGDGRDRLDGQEHLLPVRQRRAGTHSSSCSRAARGQAERDGVDGVAVAQGPQAPPQPGQRGDDPPGLERLHGLPAAGEQGLLVRRAKAEPAPGGAAGGQLRHRPDRDPGAVDGPVVELDELAVAQRAAVRLGGAGGSLTAGTLALGPPRAQLVAEAEGERLERELLARVELQ